MQHGGFFMSKVWEFFENMDECMYVADIDTHELIYMNKKALNIYGFKRSPSYLYN